jgi:hypothetical protein
MNTQREIQNAKAVVKRKAQIAAGICRCGSKAAEGVKMCPKCLGDAREASRNTYRLRVGIPLDDPKAKRGRKSAISVPKKRSERKSATSLVKGVTRQTSRDGYGREDDYYVASVMIKGKAKARRWSITKYGESGAKLAASLQKLLWVVENGLWNPADGDPLAIMSYSESFNGNRDYDDCEISDVSSPWIQECEDFA